MTAPPSQGEIAVKTSPWSSRIEVITVTEEEMCFPTNMESLYELLIKFIHASARREIRSAKKPWQIVLLELELNNMKS